MSFWAGYVSEGIKNKHSHGNKKRQKTKQKHLPRTNTEFHGKDRSRDTEIRASRSICHEKNTAFRAGCVSDGWARKHKHLPRNFTEKHGNKNKQKKTNTEWRTINQSRMRERRYKYTVWEGPLRQAQGPGFRTASERKHKNGTPHTQSWHWSGCKTQRFKWSSCSGVSPSQLICL